MNVIELERWKPSKEDPRKLEYAGQPTAQEVFEALKHRLEDMGYLPGEYFLMNGDWENGRKIPRDTDIFCTVDYGASEGIYLDVYLKWYEDGKAVIKGFITGKTLDENDEVCKLLDGGMDFDQYRRWAQARNCTGHEDTMQALEGHWSGMRAEAAQDPALSGGGMALG